MAHLMGGLHTLNPAKMCAHVSHYGGKVGGPNGASTAKKPGESLCLRCVVVFCCFVDIFYFIAVCCFAGLLCCFSFATIEFD
jgi:hypothetical protein